MDHGDADTFPGSPDLKKIKFNNIMI
jgi:hypothetical protein